MRHPTLRCITELPWAVMGIVNVTPDSFSDGGRYLDTAAACRHALDLVHQGAAIIDIGGESTRPGAAPVSQQQECDRVLAVIEHVARECDCVISVDTTKSAVARQALAAGAHWVNDISAGRFDPHMHSVVAQAGCPVVLMHSRSTPAHMQNNPWYSDPVGEVCSELETAASAFCEVGVDRDNIILDPGIGFGKRVSDNTALIAGCAQIVALGYPVLLGASRKSFIGALTGRTEPGDRLAGSLAAVVAGYSQGVRLFRVHDVAPTVDALAVASACLPEIKKVSDTN